MNLLSSPFSMGLQSTSQRFHQNQPSQSNLSFQASSRLIQKPHDQFSLIQVSSNPSLGGSNKPALSPNPNLGSHLIRFGRQAWEKARDLSYEKAEKMKPALAAQRSLIDAMMGVNQGKNDIFGYPFQIFLKNKEGSAEIESIPATEALGHVANSKEFAIGDMHGSALKFLETLVVANMVSMPEPALEKMTAILQKLEKKKEYHPETSEADRETLNDAHQNIHELLKQMTWIGGEDRKLIIGGDFTGDRGPYDPIQIEMLNTVESQGAKIIRLASNHDHDVIAHYNKDSGKFDPVMSPQNAYSLTNALAVAKANGPAAEAQLKHMYTDYLKKSKLVYVDEKNGVVYMHSAVDDHDLEYITRKLNRAGYTKVKPYSKWNKDNLSKRAEELNAAYQDYVRQHMEDEPSNFSKVNERPQSPEFFSFPGFLAVWQRSLYLKSNELPFHMKKHGMKHFVHGHDTTSKDSPHHLRNRKQDDTTVVNLDNNVRKAGKVDGSPSPIFVVQ